MNKKVLLFCFPHAGGNPRLFHDWQRRLPSLVVRPMQPPGRGLRFGETPISDFGALADRFADDLLSELSACGSDNYLLFGHSAGARFAFGTALSVMDRGGPAPMHCILAGSSAPHRALTDRQRSELSDEALIEALRRMGGSPAQVLSDASLMALMLPVLRADFRANEGAHVVQGRQLSCTFTLIAAEDDREFDPRRVFEWRAYTTGLVRRVLVPGDHFSLVHAPDAVLREIQSDLSASELAGLCA